MLYTDDDNLGDSSETEITESSEHKDRRPKLYKNVSYRMRNADDEFRGKVVKVGKAKSKNKDKCWIDVDGTDKIEVIDFIRDVEKWNYEKKVNFNEEGSS